MQRRHCLFFVGLLSFGLSGAKPQQQSVWIFQQPIGAESKIDLSVENILANLLKPTQSKEISGTNNLKQSNLETISVSRCYREDVPTIDVNLYYEALCPGCMNFVSTELYPMFQKLHKYVNLKLLPYGNTRMETDNSGKMISKPFLVLNSITYKIDTLV